MPASNRFGHWIMTANAGTFSQKSLDHFKRRCLAHVVGLGFEGSPPDGARTTGEGSEVPNCLVDEQPLLALIGSLHRAQQIELDSAFPAVADQCFHFLEQ